MRCLDGITYTMSFSKLRETVKDREACVLHPWGHEESEMTEQLKNKKRELPGQGLKSQSRQS